MTTRRRFIARSIATGALALAAPQLLTRRAGAAEPVRVMTGFGFLPNFIEIMNAKSGGHFAKQGLDATVIGANGTASELQQIVAGQAQFGRIAALDMMRAVAKQPVPLTAIATICQGSSFQLISLKDKPIRTAQELKGKTVGLVSVGGTTDIFLDLILAKAGLKKDDVQRQTTGDNPGAVEFVKRGRVDCFIASLNTVVAIERSGTPVTYWSTDKNAPMPGQVYFGTGPTIAQKPDLALAFLRAMRASVEELLSQPIGPIFQRAAKDFDIPGLTNLDMAVAVQQATQQQLWLSEGKENLLRNVPALWQAGLETLRAAHLAEIPDPGSLYTNRFVDQAMKG